MWGTFSGRRWKGLDHGLLEPHSTTTQRPAELKADLVLISDDADLVIQV